MRVELKQIVKQLNDALGLPEGKSVCALIDDECYEITGWAIVNVSDDGSIEPILGSNCATIKEMIDKSFL